MSTDFADVPTCKDRSFRADFTAGPNREYERSGLSGYARILGLVALLGCGSGAKELLDTARLEEVQNNPTHARELYQELMRRYPDTPEARTADERLRALSAPAN